MEFMQAVEPNMELRVSAKYRGEGDDLFPFAGEDICIPHYHRMHWKFFSFEMVLTKKLILKRGKNIN